MISGFPSAAAVALALIGVIGSFIILYLRSIKSELKIFTDRLEKTQDGLSVVRTEFANCKVDCERNFISWELFLRETGYTRRSIENLTQSVNRMEGTLKVVEKLPQICGDISRSIVS